MAGRIKSLAGAAMIYIPEHKATSTCDGRCKIRPELLISVYINAIRIWPRLPD